MGVSNIKAQQSTNGVQWQRNRKKGERELWLKLMAPHEYEHKPSKEHCGLSFADMTNGCIEHYWGTGHEKARTFIDASRHFGRRWHFGATDGA
jgi:hypothetical protein